MKANRFLKFYQRVLFWSNILNMYQNTFTWTIFCKPRSTVKDMIDSENTGPHGKVKVHIIQSSTLGSPLLVNFLGRMPNLVGGVMKRGLTNTTCLTRPWVEEASENVMFNIKWDGQYNTAHGNFGGCLELYFMCEKGFISWQEGKNFSVVSGHVRQGLTRCVLRSHTLEFRVRPCSAKAWVVPLTNLSLKITLSWHWFLASREQIRLNGGIHPHREDRDLAFPEESDTDKVGAIVKGCHLPTVLLLARGMTSWPSGNTTYFPPAPPSRMSSCSLLQ